MTDAVYWTFPDRVFSYECRGCGACCKGLGIGMDAANGEVTRTMGLYPELAAFARPRGEAWTAINPRGSCWFMRDDGLCRVEVDHGREAKPAVCRLFPFNRVFKLGKYTVVDFNSVVCPLEAHEDGVEDVGLSGRVTHSDIAAELKGIKDQALVATALPFDGDETQQTRYIEQERRVASACFKPGATLTDALEAQMGGAEAALGVINAVQEAWEAVLGRPYPTPSAKMAAAALWLTPSMRFNERFGPRRYTSTVALERALGRMWWVWLGFLADGEALAGRALTMQEATGLWSAQASLAYVLGCWDMAPTLGDGPLEIGANGERKDRVMAIAKASHANRRTLKPLGKLAQGALAGQPAFERIATLRAMEPMVPNLRFRKARG